MIAPRESLAEAPAPTSRPETDRRVRDRAGVYLSGVSATVVVIGLLRTDPSDIGELGLITILPLYAIIAFFVLAIAALVAIFASSFDERAAAFGVAGFVATISATPAIVYSIPRFEWAFKHIGIVDYLMRTERFDPSIDTLGIYHNWPGFFAGAAALTEWLGFEDAIAIAAWTPLLLNLATLASLIFLLGHFTTSRRTVWLAGLLFFVTNWIGQDYFSPQAVAYVLYLTILGLAMRFYRPLSRQRPTLAVHLTMTVMILAMVASHQLTPLVLIVALAGLVLWRRTARVWIPLSILVGSLALWFGSWARDFVFDNLSDQVGDIDWPLSNAQETLAKATARSDAQVLVALAGRALIAGVTLLAIVGLIVRTWRGLNYRAPLVLLGAPMSMLVLAFGGEILFRVVLFMLPMLSLLAAETLRSLGPRLLQGVASAAVVVVGLAAFGLAYFGKDSFYAFTESELAVVTELMDSAPPNSLLVEASRNYPALFLNYERFTYVPIDREEPASHEEILADPGDELYEWLTDDRYNASYLLLTESQHRSAQALGALPPNFVPEVERALRADPRFEVAFEGPDAVVFVAAQP